MKLIIFLSGLIELLSRLLDAHGKRQAEKEKAAYEAKIDDIHADPVAYGNRKFRVLPSEAKPKREDLHGDTTGNSAD